MAFNWGAFAGGAAQGGGMLAGPVLSYFGATKQRDANEEMARAGMNFESAEALRQMEFQERMSNTSVQRRREDMMAAGINPLLAAGEGASSPAGSMASAKSIPAPESALSALGVGIGNLGNSAGSMARMFQDISESNSRIKLNSDLGDKARADAGLAATSAKKAGAEAYIEDLKKRFYEKLFSSASDVKDQLKLSIPDMWKRDDVQSDHLYGSPQGILP